MHQHAEGQKELNRSTHQKRLSSGCTSSESQLKQNWTNSLCEPKKNRKYNSHHRQVTNLDGIPIISVSYWEWYKCRIKSAKKKKCLSALSGFS
ncbi:hypothetical protein ACHAXR_011166 [Thalassiosira sp. AJA248-18]